MKQKLICSLLAMVLVWAIAWFSGMVLIEIQAIFEGTLTLEDATYVKIFLAGIITMSVVTVVDMFIPILPEWLRTSPFKNSGR